MSAPGSVADRYRVAAGSCLDCAGDLNVALGSVPGVTEVDGLHQLPGAIRLARRAVTNLRQNIALSLAAVAILITCALAGQLNLASGLLLNEGGAVLIVLNGLRLLRPQRPPHTARAASCRSEGAPPAAVGALIAGAPRCKTGSQILGAKAKSPVGDHPALPVARDHPALAEPDRDDDADDDAQRVAAHWERAEVPHALGRAGERDEQADLGHCRRDGVSHGADPA